MKEDDYGAPLDSSGYAPSIMQKYRSVCYLSGRTPPDLVRHEVFHGSFRIKSKKLGLWVWLDPVVHLALHYRYPEDDLYLKKLGQTVAMKKYGWTTEQFIKEFGKNYLED